MRCDLPHFSEFADAAAVRRAGSAARALREGEGLAGAIASRRGLDPLHARHADLGDAHARELFVVATILRPLPDRQAAGLAPRAYDVAADCELKD